MYEVLKPEALKHEAQAKAQPSAHSSTKHNSIVFQFWLPMKGSSDFTILPIPDTNTRHK
jgi:hypothetical protein